MKLALLSGGYPPDFDAIGQYTRSLSEALTALGHDVTVLTSTRRDVASEDGAIRVRGVFDPACPKTLRALPEAVERAGVEWVVVQYNPFSFGPRGFCPQLPTALKTIQQRGIARVAVMFHETCVPRWPLKCAVMWTWQIVQFFRLCRETEMLFVATERWAMEVNRIPGASRPLLLPVGSNIPHCPLEKNQAREAAGIDPESFVVGIFGNNHPSRLLDWAGEAVRVLDRSVTAATGRGATLLYVGKDGATVRTFCKASHFRDEGPLSDEEVAVRLRTMDCLVAPFSDGISARRSSVIAGLLHNLPVMTTSSPWSDRLLLEHPLIFSTPVSAGPAAFAALGDGFHETCRRSFPAFDFEASPFGWMTAARKLACSLSGSL